MRDRKRKKSGSCARSGGRWWQRQSSCDRRAQSLQEVRSEESDERMTGEEILSVMFAGNKKTSHHQDTE